MRLEFKGKVLPFRSMYRWNRIPLEAAMIKATMSTAEKQRIKTVFFLSVTSGYPLA
jgi:hypothetical protein